MTDDRLMFFWRMACVGIALAVFAMSVGCAKQYEFRGFKITTCSEHPTGCERRV